MPVVIPSPSVSVSWTYTFAPYPSPWPYVIGQAAPQGCIDTVRFLIGDVNSADPQLVDGEITGLLAQNSGNPYQSAIEAARSLAARYARQVDKTTGDLSIKAAERSKAYAALVKSLTAQAIRFSTPVPYAGGISISDKDANQDDDDLVTPEFFKHMHDDRGTSTAFGDMPEILHEGFGRDD